MQLCHFQFCLHSQWGSTLKEAKSLRCKFFKSRQHFSLGKPTSHRSCFPLKWQKNMSVYLNTFKLHDLLFLTSHLNCLTVTDSSDEGSQHKHLLRNKKIPMIIKYSLIKIIEMGYFDCSAAYHMPTWHP